MRTTERLRGLKEWTYDSVCKGREYKVPAPQMDITKIIRKEPSCYIGWAPSRLADGQFLTEAGVICPGILIMHNQSYVKYTEEKRFDRYSNIHRPQEMGQHLSVSILFSIYEPGVRLPGFIESAGENGQGVDMSLILEGTEQGLMTLMNWMDDFKIALLAQKHIPKTDLYVEDDTITYSMYTDQNYVVDKRPIFYGFVNASFSCYVEEGQNPDFEKYLN